jgi:hypothetical protein
LSKRSTTILILITLTVLAASIRAPELGKWGLAVDEYYFSRSVSFILEKGIPEFPDGGYYTRGIGLQYLAAVPALIFEDWEFAVRLVPFIFGVLTIPLFYLISRLFLPNPAAILCTIILLLSSWHIEFSRFARMYTAFQFAFLVFLYFLYSGYWQGKRNHQIAAWIVAFLSIFLYEGSIFLPLLLLLAWFSDDSAISRKESIELIGVAGVLLGLNYLAHGVGFRSFGVENVFPPGQPPSEGGGSIVLPRLHLVHAVWSSIPSILSYLLLVGAAVFVLHRQIRLKKDFWSVVFVALTALLPLMHQFGLLFFLLLLFFLGRRDTLHFLMENHRFWIPYLSGVFFFWLIFGFLSRDVWLAGAGLPILSKQMANNLFRYPDFYSSLYYPFSKAVPIWGISALLAIGISVIHHLSGKCRSPSRFMLMVTLSCLLLLGIFETPSVTTRYSFFFFPTVLIIGFMEAVSLSQWLKKFDWKKPFMYFRQGAVIIPLIVFTITEDFNPHHILHVSSEQTNFRLGKYKTLADHWYKRPDFEGPARFVNSMYKEGDNIVVDYAPSSFYLKKPFINYIPLENKRFRDVARQGGNEEAWTRSPLIYQLDILLGLVPPDPQRSLWLIGAQEDLGGGLRHDIEALNVLAERNHIRVTREFEGIDGRIGVWRLSRSLPVTS